MSLKALQAIEDHKQRESATSLKRWRELMNRLVKKDDLNNNEAIELDTLHTQLGIVPALADYAAKALEHPGKRDARKQHERAVAASHAADQAIVAHEKAGEDLTARHASEAQSHRAQAEGLINARLSAVAKLQQAEAACDELVALENELWQLLGEQDPTEVAAEQAAQDAIEANRRHVSHNWKGIDDRYRDAKYPIVKVEIAVADPNKSWGNLAECEFIPLPDQTAEEMEQLVGIVRSIHTDDRSWRYLVNDDNGEFIASLQHSSLHAWFEFAEVNKSGGGFNPSIYRWMRCPGQTQEQLEKMLNKLQRAHDTRFADMPDDWIADQQGHTSRAGIHAQRANVIRVNV